MKKFILISIAAIAAAVVLCSATSSPTANGTVRFESSSVPALNFTMPASRAMDIYRLLPESVTTVCTDEYGTVREKCLRSSSFTHKGVKVQRTGENSSMTIILTVSGNEITLSGVSWEDLDLLFNGRD